jgi:hypothetical protein
LRINADFYVGTLSPGRLKVFCRFARLNFPRESRSLSLLRVRQKRLEAETEGEQNEEDSLSGMPFRGENLDENETRGQLITLCNPSK